MNNTVGLRHRVSLAIAFATAAVLCASASGQGTEGRDEDRGERHEESQIKRGPFTSTNLTPDYAGKPAGLTLNEFLKVLRTGHDPKDPPGDLLQVMPWPVFSARRPSGI